MGREQHVDWTSSWRLQQVGDGEWGELKARVRREYAGLIETLESLQNWREQQLGDSMAIVAHMAYHLGAIRHALKNADSQRWQRTASCRRPPKLQIMLVASPRKSHFLNH